MIEAEVEGLKFSSIPTIQNYDKSALKAQSSFLKSSSQQVSLTPASKSEQNAKPDSDRKYSDVIVISPGSRTLRFGLASDAKPHEAAHAIARKMHRACESPSRTSSENGDAGREIADAGHPTSVPSAGKRINRGIFPTYNYRDDLDSVLGRFKDIIDSRLELNKLEVVSDAQEQIRSYNKVSQVAVLPDYNDPDETDWIRDSDSDFVVGNKALKVEALNIKGYDGADREEYTWELFYPLRHGCLNVTSYHSIRHCMEDMMLIWKSLIETELNIPEKQFASYLVVLVIPDIFNKQQVCDTVTALLLGLKFRAVTFIQESTAAAFAAGATSACIVNIGAQQTTVACVDDGVCISDSRFNVKYGGDDVTRFLFEILKRSNFPSTDIDIYDTVSGWILIEKIKEKCCTLSEVDLAIEETAFYVFSPNSPTKKYQMKYYYEVALAPLLLFHPTIIDFCSKLEDLALKENWLDYSLEDDAETSFLTKHQLSLILRHNREDCLPAIDTSIQKKNDKAGDSRKRKTNQLAEEGFTSDNVGEVAECKDTIDSSRIGIDSENAAAKCEDNASLSNNGSNSSKNGNNKKQKLKSDQPSSTATAKSSDQKFDVPLALDAYMRYRRGIDPIQKASLPLDISIVGSIKGYISSLSDARTKDIESYVQKILGSIILIGGGSMIKGLPALLKEKISGASSDILSQAGLRHSEMDPTQKMQCRVIHDSKEIDPRHYCWKGASVFSKLESAADTWISRQEWESGGISKVFPKLIVPWY